MTRDPEPTAPSGAMPTALRGHVFQQPMPTQGYGRGTPAVDRVAVAAAYVVTGDLATVNRLRTAPGPAGNPPASLLRHADDQAVLAAAAVLHAAAAAPHLGPFADWAVVASPCELGRFGCGSVIEKFHTDGVRGVPPHAIPNLCLHAAAATVSIALAARGPSFGTGGGPGHVADGLLRRSLVGPVATPRRAPGRCSPNGTATGPPASGGPSPWRWCRPTRVDAPVLRSACGPARSRPPGGRCKSRTASPIS